MLCGGALLVFGVALLTYSINRSTPGEMAQNPYFFPVAILTIWCVLSGVLLAQSISSESDSRLEKSDLSALLKIVATVIASAVLFSRVGFVLSSIITVVAVLGVMRYRNLVVSVILVVTFPVALWYVFTRILNVPLPTSPWLSWI